MSFLWWCFCVVSLWLRMSAADSDSWSVDVPHTVVGLEASCVVIPCKFNYPDPDRKDLDFTGIWLTDSDEKVYQNVDISPNFQRRTSLVGDLKNKNCSLKISPLKHTDKGPFTFRIEIKHVDKYSFLKNKVSITIKDSPDKPVLTVEKPMKSGEKVTSTCSVLHTCPSDPPRLTWSHNGQVSIQISQQNKDQWKVTSSLSFTPSRTDHNTSISCTAEFHGGKKVTNTKTLNVTYPPASVEMISKSPVMEGDSVELKCSSDGNPAAHVYQWFSENNTLLSSGPTFILKDVSKHIQPLYCTAANTDGQASSKITQLKVLYPPEIKAGSSCTSEISTVTCLCMVDSNPISDILWWSSDSSVILHSSSTERHGFLTIATLQGAPDSHTIHCQASNSVGNSTIALPVPHSGKLMYIAVGVSAFLVIIIGLTVWMIKRSFGKSRTEQPVTQAKTEMNLTTPSDSKGKCEDHNYDAYSGSQHVYGNMALEDDYEPAPNDVTNDDEIYANV